MLPHPLVTHYPKQATLSAGQGPLQQVHPGRKVLNVQSGSSRGRQDTSLFHGSSPGIRPAVRSGKGGIEYQDTGRWIGRQLRFRKVGFLSVQSNHYGQNGRIGPGCFATGNSAPVSVPMERGSGSGDQQLIGARATVRPKITDVGPARAGVNFPLVGGGGVCGLARESSPTRLGVRRGGARLLRNSAGTAGIQGGNFTGRERTRPQPNVVHFAHKIFRFPRICFTQVQVRWGIMNGVRGVVGAYQNAVYVQTCRGVFGVDQMVPLLVADGPGCIVDDEIPVLRIRAGVPHVVLQFAHEIAVRCVVPIFGKYPGVHQGVWEVHPCSEGDLLGREVQRGVVGNDQITPG